MAEEVLDFRLIFVDHEVLGIRCIVNVVLISNHFSANFSIFLGHTFEIIRCLQLGSLFALPVVSLPHINAIVRDVPILLFQFYGVVSVGFFAGVVRVNTIATHATLQIIIKELSPI